MKKVLIVCLFTSILSISCNNPDITSDKIISNTQKELNLSLKKARLKNNMAYFDSFESLADSLRALQNQDLKSLLSKQKANNFNSLYGYYLGYDESMYENQIKKYLEKDLIDDNLIIVNSEGDTHIEEKVSIKELAFVLNETREVLIGNNLVKYDYDYFESTDLITNKTERKQIRKIFGPNNRKGKIAATNSKSDKYRHNGRNYKIEVQNNSTSECSNAGIGRYRSRHYKAFLGIYYSNSTNFVAVYGNNQKGTVQQYFTDPCVLCSTNTQSNSVNVSCMGCSTAEWQEGICFSNHSGVWGAFNCADGVARQIYL